MNLPSESEFHRPRRTWKFKLSNSANKEKADALIKADKRITIDELSPDLGVSHDKTHNIESFGYLRPLSTKTTV